MVSRQRLEQLLNASLAELGGDLDLPALAAATPETVLFGSGGALDSLGLVNLIADVENRMAEELGRDVVIADERAMSRSKSPFRTVGTLTDYLVEILREQEGA